MMHILAMDTSGPSLSVALLREDTLVYECTQQNGLTHSDGLMLLVDRAMQAGKITPEQVDCFAAVTGPGSFTGVRIGVATAKSLAHATGKPTVGINALEALATGIPFFDGVVCAMQDARAGQVYAAAYRGSEMVRPDRAEKLDIVLSSLAELGEKCCFTGDGAIAHRDLITNAFGDRAVFPPQPMMVLRASTVAILARDRQSEWAGWEMLMPYYLRAPQAERERLAREAAHG